MIDQQSLQEAKNLIERSGRILVIPSSPPDGDSLGSAVALFLAFQKLGKMTTIVTPDPVPDLLQFLPNIEAIRNELEQNRDFIITIDTRNAKIKEVRPEVQTDRVHIVVTPESGTLAREDFQLVEGKPSFDLIITVDAGDVSQFGHLYEQLAELFHAVPVINIDHHVSNSFFGKVNLVDVMASATTALVKHLIELLGHGLIDADIATLLLAGLITDTGSFQNPNTNPEAFELAAQLIEMGARQQEIIQHVYKTKELSTLKLWGRILEKIQWDPEHRLVWSTISKQDLEETGSRSEKTEGVIDELMSNAPDAEIVLLIKEREDGAISGSIRTPDPKVSAARLAELFGGGGHTQAAGFRINGKSLEAVEQEVIAKFRQYQKGDGTVQSAPTNIDPAPAGSVAAQKSGTTGFPEPMDMR